MRYEVRFSAKAEDDLIPLFDYIGDASGLRIAENYVERIEAFCRRLSDFPLRGTARDDLSPGVRTSVFAGRATIAYSIGEGSVRIERIFYAGREIDNEDFT